MVKSSLIGLRLEVVLDLSVEVTVEEGTCGKLVGCSNGYCEGFGKVDE